MRQTLPHLPELLASTFRAQHALRLQALPAQLSTRRYYRQELTGTPKSLVVMRLPDEAGTEDAPSRAQAHAFVDVQRFLSAREVSVPRIYAEDIAHGLLLLEDLGDETFEARLRRVPEAHWSALYAQAVELLVRLHTRAELAEPSECIALRRHYDAALLGSELDHFREWGLEALHGPLTEADRALLSAHFDDLTQRIVALPSGFVHRDFQSKNLMWAPDGRLVTLDFQDAFMGPQPYDLVALLCDSYVALEPALQDAMLQYYATLRDYSAAQRAQLLRGFRLITVQRKLKDAGRFVFIDRVRGNPDFLRYYPASLRYVRHALGQLPELAGLGQLLSRFVPELAESSAA